MLSKFWVTGSPDAVMGICASDESAKAAKSRVPLTKSDVGKKERCWGFVDNTAALENRPEFDSVQPAFARRRISSFSGLPNLKKQWASGATDDRFEAEGRITAYNKVDNAFAAALRT